MQAHTIYLVVGYINWSSLSLRSDDWNVTWRPTYEEAHQVADSLQKERDRIQFLRKRGSPEELMEATNSALDRYAVLHLDFDIKYKVEPIDDNFEEIKAAAKREEDRIKNRTQFIPGNTLTKLQLTSGSVESIADYIWNSAITHEPLAVCNCMNCGSKIELTADIST